MRLWLCLLLLCSVAGRAAADDDEEGGVYGPGQPVQWRVKIDVSTKSHLVVQSSPQSARLTQDESSTVNSTYVVEIDSAAVVGPGYGILVDTDSKATVGSTGGGSYAGQTTIEDGHDKLTGHADGSLASLRMSFSYSSKSKRFSLEIGRRYRTSGVDAFGKPSPPDTGSAVPIILGDLTSKRIGTLTVSGKRFAVDADLTTGTGEARSEVHAHITMEPLQASKYIAVLTPAKRDVYDAWVPLGPTIPGTDEAKGGNDLDLVLQVRNKATNKLAVVPYSAVWSINGTRLPGWCMNYPKKADANDHWDLYFDPAKNNKTWKIQQDGEQLIVASTSGDQHAIISSRDYGGHAVVSATVTVDGATLIAHVDNGTSIGDAGIRVPKDDDQNHIADAWQAANRSVGRDATDDDDIAPTGMFNKGDGLDVFEEYRGFAVLDPVAVMAQAPPAGIKTVFQRLDPTTKEMFVTIEGDASSVPSLLYGALRFAEITKLAMYMVPAELLEPMAGDVDAKHPRTLTTRIDPSDADFGLPQAAVWITTRLEPKKPSPAYTPFVSDDPDEVAFKHHGSPTQVEGVEIFVANAENQIKFWMSIFDHVGKYPGSNKRFDELVKQHPDWNLTRDGLQAYATAHFADLERDFLAWTTMHELGHAFGARHHEAGTGAGDGACPMRYWNDTDPAYVAMFLSGHWTLTTHDPTGADWKFCSEDWPDMRVWQQPDDIDARGKH